MTIQDQVISALTAWRECRNAGTAGLTAIINVIVNRASRVSPYTVCTQHAQFSSISMPGPESYLWPGDQDPQWLEALSQAEQAAAGTLPDLTNGSTLYYAPHGISSNAIYKLPSGITVPFPQHWNPDVITYQAEIGNQLFFTQN
jgi:hypothetical protein